MQVGGSQGAVGPQVSSVSLCCELEGDITSQAHNSPTCSGLVCLGGGGGGFVFFLLLAQERMLTLGKNLP